MSKFGSRLKLYGFGASNFMRRINLPILFSPLAAVPDALRAQGNYKTSTMNAISNVLGEGVAKNAVPKLLAYVVHTIPIVSVVLYFVFSDI